MQWSYRATKDVFDWLPISEICRFGRSGWLTEPSSSKDNRFGRLWRDLHFHLQTSESEVDLLELLRCLQSTFTRVDWKPHFHQDDSETCSLFWRILCLIGNCVSFSGKSTVFQNLVGVGLSIKYTPNIAIASIRKIRTKHCVLKFDYLVADFPNTSDDYKQGGR